MRLLLGSNSTKKSASLARGGSASPRATEPKTRTLEAPWRAATSRISRFFSLQRSLRVCLGPVSVTNPRAAAKI